MARARHVVENGMSLAAQSTWPASAFALSTVPFEALSSDHPNVVCQRLKLVVAIRSRAADKAAMASAVRRFDRQRLANVYQLHCFELSKKIIDIGTDVQRLALELGRKLCH